MMERDHKNKYYVVEFLQKPYDNIDQYVCVPYSWIKFFKRKDRRIAVAYPAENLSSIKDNVRKVREIQAEWKFYYAFEKHSTDSFKNAEIYIKTNTNNIHKQNGSSNVQISVNKPRTKRKTRSLKQSASSDHQVNKTRIEKPLKINRNAPIKLCLKRPMSSNSRYEIFRKRPRKVVNETHKSVNELSSHLDKSLQSSSEKQLLPIGNGCSIQEPCDQITIETPTAANRSVDNKTHLNSTSNFCPPSEHLNEEKLLTVQTNCSAQEPKRQVVKNNIKLNEINNRPDLKSTNAVLLVNQSDQPSKHLLSTERGRPSANYLHPHLQMQQIRAQKPIEESTDIDLSGSLPRNTVNSSDKRNSQNLTNEPCYLSQHSHDYFLASNVLHPDPRLQNLQKKTDSDVIHQRPYLQNNTTNILPIMPKSSYVASLPSQTSVGSHKDPLLTVERTCLYQDLNEREILFGKPMNVNNNNQRVWPQNSINGFPPALQNLQNFMNEFSGLPKYAHQSATGNVNYAHEDPRRVEIHSIPKNIQSSQSNYSNLISQSCHLSGPMLKKPVLQKYRDHLPENPRIQTTLPERSNEANGSDETARTQSTNTIIPNSLQGILDKPVKIIAKKDPKETSTNLSSGFSTIKNNTQPVVQNFPISANQTCHFSEHFHGKQFSPVYGNHCLQCPRVQKVSYERPIQINSLDQTYRPQGVLPNTSFAVQNPTNSSNHLRSSCKCSNVKQVLPLAQDQSYQNLHVQETHFKKSTELNRNGESVCLESNTKTSQSAIQNTPKQNQSFKNSSQEQLSAIQKYSSVEEILTEIIPVAKINTAIHSRQSSRPKSNKDNNLTVNQSLSTSNREVNGKAIAEQALITAFRGIFENIQLSYSNTSKLLNDERTASTELNEMIQQTLKRMDRYCEVKNNNVVASSSTDTSPSVKLKVNTEPEQNKSNQRVTLNFDDADDDDDYETDDDGDSSDDDDYIDDNHYHKDYVDDTHYDVPKKSRQKRSFLLPPEYNPNDSKWTLKHQEASLETVELVPHSRVYINTIRLANCKLVAKDYKTFARMLLTEIFSQNALSVCSLTGARANAFDVYDTDVRPGLDKDARTLLLTFVEEHGSNKGWGLFDSQAVVNSIRSKIQEIRAKYGRCTVAKETAVAL